MYSNINYYDRKPILKETKDARKRMVIEQDPKKEKSIQLLRSEMKKEELNFHIHSGVMLMIGIISLMMEAYIT